MIYLRHSSACLLKISMGGVIVLKIDILFWDVGGSMVSHCPSAPHTQLWNEVVFVFCFYRVCHNEMGFSWGFPVTKLLGMLIYNDKFYIANFIILWYQNVMKLAIQNSSQNVRLVTGSFHKKPFQYETPCRRWGVMRIIWFYRWVYLI